MNGLLSNPRFVTAIDNPDGNKLGIISAAYSLGALIGVVPAPWVADKYGRKASIACGAIIIIAGSMVQTFTTGGNAMLGGRLVVGLGASFQNIGGGPLVAEVAHPRNRAQATALINTCWYIGSIIAAWTTFGALNIASSWSWRICCLIQAVPCALQLVGLWFCEESPRWLISKGQDQKALGVLAKYHGNGDENDELVSFEFQEIREAIAAERAATANVNVWSLTKTKGNRHRLLILIVSQLQMIQTALTSFSVWPSSPSGSETVSSRTTSPKFSLPSVSPTLLHKLDSTAVFRSSIGWLL
jgi:MFS family permease